jgi:hypothetical protein
MHNERQRTFRKLYVQVETRTRTFLQQLSIEAIATTLTILADSLKAIAQGKMSINIARGVSKDCGQLIRRVTALVNGPAVDGVSRTASRHDFRHDRDLVRQHQPS